ncbi:hypothetical protein BGW39_004663, partial [Mortierella sp. 14UC]
HCNYVLSVIKKVAYGVVVILDALSQNLAKGYGDTPETLDTAVLVSFGSIFRVAVSILWHNGALSWSTILLNLSTTFWIVTSALGILGIGGARARSWIPVH